MDSVQMTTIRIKDATKIYGEQTVLDHVSLEMKSGVIYGFVGQNGSGKTVLFKCICGFTKLTKGSIEVLGKVVGEDVDMAENVGAIIENPGFLANYNAFKNLKFLAALTNKIDDAEIRRNIAQVGLDPYSKKKVGKFSLGMRQRLGIAQAIMENPDILVLDECMNGLDSEGVAVVKKRILQAKEEGKLILLCSHIAGDLQELCDVIFEMDGGSIRKKLLAADAVSKQ